MDAHERTVRRPAGRPKVLIVGGVDVDNRIDLMEHIAERFTVAAAGSAMAAWERFAAARFAFFHYPMRRGVHPLGDLRSVASLRRLFASLRPDVVHTFATKPGVWARLAARSAGVPVVIGTLPGLGVLYAYDSLQARAVKRIYEPLQRAASHVSDLTILQNMQDLAELIAHGVVPASKAVVVPGSGVRTDIFDPASFPAALRLAMRAKLGLGPASVVVTMVSRLIRSKGVLEYGHAARIVRQHHANTEFLLVGAADHDSVDRLDPAELDDLARTVVWLGPRDDIPEILAATDIFVLPSFYREGIPRVLLEAASMGLPLVTTAAPGCMEVARAERNGLLVPPRDAPALAAAIARLAARPALRERFGKASRELAVSRFDSALIGRDTIALYGRLLAAKAPPAGAGTQVPEGELVEAGR